MIGRMEETMSWWNESPVVVVVVVVGQLLD